MAGRPTFPEYPPNFMDDGIPKGVLSMSGFNMMRKCPKQFEYSYVLGVVSAPGIAMTKGKAVHKGAEMVHRSTIETGKPLTMDAAVQVVADDFDIEKDKIEDWTDPDTEEKLKPGAVKDAALANFRVYYVQAVPLIKPVAVEKTFAKKFGTVPMRGVIDLIDKVPGEYTVNDDPEQSPPLVEVVSDLKLTRKMWSDQQIENNPQLTAYALVENTDRVRVDLLLDQKKGTQYKPIRSFRYAKIKNDLIEDLETIVAQIKTGIFSRCDPTAWNCSPKWCGYFARCRGAK